MAEIDFDNLTYRKEVIDTKDKDIKDSIQLKLDNKVNESDIGGPNGIPRLVEGIMPSIMLPFATSQNASDGIRNDLIMSPENVRQELTTASNLFVPLSQKDQANGIPSLDGLSKIPVVQIPYLDYIPLDHVGSQYGVASLDHNGKVPATQIPDVGSVSSFYVETINEMIALIGVVSNDRCIVTNNTPDPLKNGEYAALIDNPSIEADWVAIPAYNAVTSVNGKIGVVNIIATDIPEIGTNTSAITALDGRVTTNETAVLINANDIQENTDLIATMQSFNNISTNEFTTNIDMIVNIGLYTVSINTPDSNPGSLEVLATNSQDARRDQFFTSEATGKKYSRFTNDKNDFPVVWTSWNETASYSTATDIMSFQTDLGSPSLTEGQMAYNSDIGRHQIKGDISDSTLDIGYESLIRVYNATGSTIPNGSVVYQVGVQSGTPSVGLSMADTFNKAKGVSIATHDIPSGTYGNCTRYGEASDIPTNQNGESWIPGDLLFLSDTVPGGMTKVMPPIATQVGVLLTNNGSTGKMMINTNHLISLPPIGGWMKSIPTTIEPLDNVYTNFTGFQDVISSKGVISDGTNGTYTFEVSGTYEISISVSLSDIIGQNNGSVITIEFWNETTSVSLFEYNIIVGRSDTIASGTMITQDTFNTNDVLVCRYKETSGGVGNDVLIQNISFNVKSILVR